MKSKTPGPGTYGEPNKSVEGRYVLSSDRNITVPSFKRPTHQKSSDRMIAPSPPPGQSPGPGTYTPTENELSNKYRNQTGVKLYRRERKIELHDKTKLDLPGPCNYQLPSEFGFVPQLSSTQSSFAIPKTTRNTKHKRSRNALVPSRTTAQLQATLTGLPSDSQKFIRTMRDPLQSSLTEFKPASTGKFLKTPAGKSQIKRLKVVKRNK